MNKTRKHHKTRNTNSPTKNNNKTKRVFKKCDYKSGDGFLTTVWGPPQWHMLHTISFNYPVEPTLEQKKQYRDYILSLRNVLPCGACRKNLKNNFKQLPLTMKDMENRDTFSRYIYNLHQLVNKMLNKKTTLTYCDVRERYEHFRSRCTSERPKVFKLAALKKTLKNKKNKEEKGCTEPLYGKKARCILNIVPQGKGAAESIKIDKKCVKRR
jgi:hypothetical protein